MSADPLSDALAIADAHAAFSGAFVAGGNWAVTLRGRDKLKVNALVRGSCLLMFEDGGDPVQLKENDVVVSDGNRPYVLCSAPGLQPLRSGQVPRDPVSGIGLLGEGDEVMCISSHVDLSQDRGGLLRGALPPLIHVRGETDDAPVLRWLVERLADETIRGRAGSTSVSDHLAHLLFVHVLRVCLADADALPAGWLRALADERLAPAVSLMHGDPAYPWRLEDLARAAAMSRTGFALHFKRIVGVPPLTYLLNWRMSLAARALRQDETPVASLAHSVGYTSESSFSNAFKRALGVAPRRYRDESRAAARPTS